MDKTKPTQLYRPAAVFEFRGDPYAPREFEVRLPGGRLVCRVASQLDADKAAQMINGYVNEVFNPEPPRPNTLTCVYCGHQYPEGTPPHGAQVLTDHIAKCEKHPMRAVIVERDALKDECAALKREIAEMWRSRAEHGIDE